MQVFSTKFVFEGFELGPSLNDFFSMKNSIEQNECFMAWVANINQNMEKFYYTL